MVESNVAEISRLVTQLRLAFEGPSWHGPSVLEALAGVDAARAHARPIAGAHTIWELVLHLAGGYSLVLRRLAGDSRNLTPEEDWPAPPSTPDDAAWQAAIQRLRDVNAAVRDAVRRFDPRRLDEPLVAEPPYSAYTQFAGLPQHDLYHAGQIVLLRKALAASTS